ncbi:MAG: DUF4175 family protein, partial [Bacteroidota bacterium]
GAKFPRIKDHLVNILQLYPERGEAVLYSVELIDASFEDVRKEIEPFDFTSITDYAGGKRFGKLIGVVTGVAAVLFALFPTAFFGSLNRLVNYDVSFAAPAPFRLIVEPGDKEVVKGETVQLTVRVDGAPQKEILLSTKPEGQLDYERRKIEADAGCVFKCDLPSLKSTTRYFASAGDISSDEYTLSVIDRPMVKVLRLQLVFPTYTKLPSRQLDDNSGDVTALKGTRISYLIESNKDLVSASLIFDDKAETALGVAGNKAAGTLALLKDRTYHILLKDKDGIANAEPIEYTLKVIPDAYPTAAIELPGRNIDIAENSSLNMLFRIKDDYGFTQLRLAHRLIQSRYERPAADFT